MSTAIFWLQIPNRITLQKLMKKNKKQQCRKTEKKLQPSIVSNLERGVQKTFSGVHRQIKHRPMPRRK